MQHDMLGDMFWGSWGFLPGNETNTIHEFPAAWHDSQQNEFWKHFDVHNQTRQNPEPLFSFTAGNKEWKEKEAE